MDTLMKADIFFFVTTICVVFLSLGLMVFIVKLIQFLNLVKKITEKIKDTALDMGEEAKELLSRVEDSFFFNLIFPPRKHSRSKKKSQ